MTAGELSPYSLDEAASVTRVQGNTVSVELVINAPSAQIFALIADAGKHSSIDGSGTVDHSVPNVGGRAAPGEESQPLELGSKFGMSMHVGVPYSMVSTIIEYEENRRLAWQTRGPGSIGAHFAGRIWRYELEPVDGGTLVRETWDISQEASLSKPLVVRGGKKTAENMDKTLARIEEIVTA